MYKIGNLWTRCMCFVHFMICFHILWLVIFLGLYPSESFDIIFPPWYFTCGILKSLFKSYYGRISNLHILIMKVSLMVIDDQYVPVCDLHDVNETLHDTASWLFNQHSWKVLVINSRWGYLPWKGWYVCPADNTPFFTPLNHSTLRPPFQHISVPQDPLFNKISQNFWISC